MNEEILNTSIDRWGEAWQRFMETNYPDEIPPLKANGRWEIIPLLIDREALQMWELLSRQYAEKNRHLCPSGYGTSVRLSYFPADLGKGEERLEVENETGICMPVAG